ncbi:MAG: UDP-N-acetylmuramyl-tripeptide synthetase [Spirochaetales bacterium]
MAPISAQFYDYPGKKLITFGVTGTDGKSSVVFLIWQFLRFLGKKAGFISTVQYSIGDDAIDNIEHRTTPEAPIIQKTLYDMLKNGCEYAVLETSSHGLSQKTNRLGNIYFDAVAMMNVGYEHLEFHGTFEQYKSDKANLFRNLISHDHIKTVGGKTITVPCLGVVNAADASARYFAECAAPCKIAGFTSKALGDEHLSEDFSAGIYRIEDIRSDKKGSDFMLYTDSQNIPVRINLPGTFNADNTVAAMIAVSAVTQTPIKELVSLAKNLIPVRGRMMLVEKGQPFEILIDYAHTPVAFETIFPPLRKRIGKKKIISVFGASGERDTQKRPKLGAIASEYSDIIIIADDDPHGEDTVVIAEDIARACTNKKRGETLFIIHERPEAIHTAFSFAEKGDLVLLLGKAHENSMIYKDYIAHYDEKAEAEKALANMGFTEKEDI